MVKWSCTKERINERGPYILVEWLFPKEGINEGGLYIFGSNGPVQIKEINQ